LVNEDLGEEQKQDVIAQSEVIEDDKQLVSSSSGTEGASDKSQDEEKEEIRCTC
jgi:hypothetical protein